MFTKVTSKVAAESLILIVIGVGTGSLAGVVAQGDPLTVIDFTEMWTLDVLYI